VGSRKLARARRLSFVVRQRSASLNFAVGCFECRQLQPSKAGFRLQGKRCRGLAPGDIDYNLNKMTLFGYVRKRLKSLVECKFAIHHRGDPVLLDETIHVFEILA
jgi:hypothetical protein